MLKSIIIFLFFLFSAIISFAQAPTYRSSSAVNVYDYKLGAVITFKLPVAADTIILTGALDSLGNIMYDKNDTSLYLRIPSGGSVKKWVKIPNIEQVLKLISDSASQIKTLYNADDTISSNRTVELNGHTLNMVSNAGGGQIYLKAAASQIRMSNSGTEITDNNNVEITADDGSGNNKQLILSFGQTGIRAADTDSVGVVNVADYSRKILLDSNAHATTKSVRQQIHDSSGNYNNANIGAGYRWVIPNTHNIKTSFAGYGIIKDSSSNTNGITDKLDSATVFPAVRATIPTSGGTVTSISQGYGIINTPNPITTTGTVKADTATLFPAVRATIPTSSLTWPQSLANGRTFSTNDSTLLGNNNFKFRGTDVRDYTSILGNKIIFNISPLTNGQPFITVNPITPEPSQLPFYFGRDTSSSLDPTIANEVMSMGFNLRANNRVISSQAAFGTQYESNWHTGPGDPRRFEYYIVHIDSAGRNNRPMFLVMTEDNKQDFWTYAVQGASWSSPTNNDSGYAAISRNYNVSNGDQAGGFFLSGASLRNNFEIIHDLLDSSWTFENNNTLKNNPLQFRDWSGLNPASPEVINFGLATEAWNIGCFKGLNCKRAIFGDYNVGSLSPVPLASHCQSTSSSNDNIRVYANDYGSYHFRIDDAGNSFFNNGTVNIGQSAIGSHTLTINGDVQINTLTNGTAGTDSVVVTNNGLLKKVAATSFGSNSNYYFRNTGGTGNAESIAINDSTVGIKKLIQSTGIIITDADSSETFKTDTALMATRARVQKGIDSVAALANTKQSALTFQQSIVNNTGTVNLVGDSTSLQGYKAYTSSAGVRTWKPIVKADLTGIANGNFLKYRASDSTMIAAVAGTDYQTPLTFSTGLTNTTGTITNNLSTGINSTNQTATGSTQSGGNLTLQSTTNGTKGALKFGAAGNSQYDENADSWGFGTLAFSNAFLTLNSGTTSKAPLVISAGTNMTSPASGAIEFDGTNYYGSAGGSPVRYTLAKTLTNTGTLNFPSTNGQATSDLTITITGAADGDVVMLGVPSASTQAGSEYTAFVSASNTITIRFTNVGLTPIDPASGTFRVSIIKY